jgi:hypothetical protein
MPKTALRRVIKETNYKERTQPKNGSSFRKLEKHKDYINRVKPFNLKQETIRRLENNINLNNHRKRVLRRDKPDLKNDNKNLETKKSIERDINFLRFVKRHKANKDEQFIFHSNISNPIITNEKHKATSDIRFETSSRPNYFIQKKNSVLPPNRELYKTRQQEQAISTLIRRLENKKNVCRLRNSEAPMRIQEGGNITTVFQWGGRTP